MNQDQVPRDAFRAGFDSHILDVRLTDATEDGGLFGLRFEYRLHTMNRVRPWPASAYWIRSTSTSIGGLSPGASGT